MDSSLGVGKTKTKKPRLMPDEVRVQIGDVETDY